MESIVAAYGSSSESSDDAASDIPDSVIESSAANDDPQVGSKRKRFNEPQWKRAFPHVDGNWPSHVRIDIPVSQELRGIARNIIQRAQEILGDAVTLIPFEELGLGDTTTTEGERVLHMSLSRPFAITYDQIDNFVDSLRAALKWRQRITLRKTIVLVNDDKTRSFLALRVGDGEHQFIQVLRCVDQCLARIERPTYYEDPIPHVSIASSLGEELAQLAPEQCESLLNPRLETQQVATPHCFTTSVAAVHVAIGNKHYDIPLR
ncbi:hypothetical protein DVH05_011916 [Phytophthora capsici]|nr:hypothetical protein DVH05_011916 [Phytophthora capsici]